MADNVSFQSTTLATPPDGTVVSTDEATSGHIQRVKLAYSADGVDTHIQADANGLLINTGTHQDEVIHPIATTDIGLTTKSTIFGYSTGGAGSFEPVKVTPSGALTVEIDDGGGSITVDGTVSIGGTAVVSVAGTASVSEVGTGTNAATQVTVSNSSTTIVSARSGRRGVLLVNYQTVAVYIDPSGGTATTSMFRIDPGATLVLPVTSAVTGITSAAYSASGDAKMHIIEFY